MQNKSRISFLTTGHLHNAVIYNNKNNAYSFAVRRHYFPVVRAYSIIVLHCVILVVSFSLGHFHFWSFCHFLAIKLCIQTGAHMLSLHLEIINGMFVPMRGMGPILHLPRGEKDHFVSF